MGRTNPDAASHQQQSMILVPVDTPGVTIERSLPVFGWQDQHGHCEITFDNVRVPVSNLLGEEGGGFAIAQARLGPGRIHHCMRAIGVAERAMALMIDRVQKRIAFGKPLAEQGMVQQQIALSRNEIDQARLLCHKAAWTIDQHGNKSREAQTQVAQIKAVAPQMACDVIDRAIQVHGGAGVSDDFPLARLYGVAPRDAVVRRARRGAHADHRARRTRQGEIRVRGGGDGLVVAGRQEGRELSGAWNFRDVSEQAGIAPGRFYRASELSKLDDAGRAALAGYGVTDVADLRTLRELERHGAGLVPAGVDIHHLPFIETAASDDEAPHEHAFQRMMTDKPDDESVADAAARYMTEEYGRIAAAPLARQAVHRVVTLLGSGRRVLAHCFAGKDRTGFTIAVVLEAAGVERDAIMADYLRSNAAVPQLRESILATIRERAAEAPEVLEIAEARLTEAVLGVREEYLDTARRTIDTEFGSLRGYLEAAGLTEQDIARLRAALND